MNEWVDLFPAVHFSAAPTKKRSNGKKKKKFGNWFESCNGTQLKDLCKAAKLPVSGAKSVLLQRLMSMETARNLGTSSQQYLKHLLKEQLLVQSGNKFDCVLRLLHAEFGTGAVKRAATEVVVDEKTGQTTEILKKRKTTPSPKAIYTRVQKKMHAVTQKKYQTHYGSKDHSPAVYGLMKTLIVDHCIKEKQEPLVAEAMARAAFQAFYDHWQVMVRTGYESEVLRESLDAYAEVLKDARPQLSSEEIETVVSLLESVRANIGCLSVRLKEDPCVYYSTGAGKGNAWAKTQYAIPRHENENVIEESIKVIMPEYDRKTRKKKVGKLLDCEIQAVAWMNGITLPAK